MREALAFAVRHIAQWGDTDIFTFPIDNHLFFDKPDEAVNLLLKVHSDFADQLAEQPPISVGTLSLVGYTGFRWVTQIDPLWNAYFLGLVLALAEQIESARLATARGIVFSYRLAPDAASHRLFEEGAWAQFQRRSLEHAKTHSHVLMCDIADFYARIYHHRLENALSRLPRPQPYAGQIMQLLGQFSRNVSYGLPVGGPAARILSELLLDSTDRLLASHGFVFCRYADDYHIFAGSLEEAYKALAFLSDALYRNEGLSLAKAKTRILTGHEFAATSLFAEDAPREAAEIEAREFLGISLRFDPYSATAVEDYERLREEVNSYDIPGMLSRELVKPRIHSALARKLVQAVQFLSAASQAAVVRSLAKNLPILAPILTFVLTAVRDLFREGLDEETKDHFCGVLRDLVRKGSYLVRTDLVLSYVIRVLAQRNLPENEALLAELFRDNRSPLVRRGIILAMARWRVHYWVSDVKTRYHALHEWEKRAFLVASFVLGDEGSHWRRHEKKRLSPYDELLLVGGHQESRFCDQRRSTRAETGSAAGDDASLASLSLTKGWSLAARYLM